MKQIRWKQGIKNFGHFFILMIGIQLVQVILGLPTYDFSYLVILTVLLTMGDAMAKVRFVLFGIVLFLLELNPGLILIPSALLILKYKDIHLINVFFYNKWGRKSSKKRVYKNFL